jgi:hypothetical protein
LDTDLWTPTSPKLERPHGPLKSCMPTNGGSRAAPRACTAGSRKPSRGYGGRIGREASGAPRQLGYRYLGTHVSETPDPQVGGIDEASGEVAMV